MDKHIYQAYIDILKEELVPAMGCTEPISLAYGAAKVKAVLGEMPEKVIVEVSGNIIKNVKSVIVPNTNHLKGIEAAVAAGLIAGNADKQLEVIAEVAEYHKREIACCKEICEIEVKSIDSPYIFDIQLTAYKGQSYVKLRITNHHTNITLIEKDGQLLFGTEEEARKEDYHTDRTLLNVKDILAFADRVELSEVADILRRQIEYNMRISEEGVKENYGANIGSVLLSAYGDDIRVKAKAKAAAGSDARMDGCELPVIIVSGSGNQGLTASIPVIEYGHHLNVSEDKLLRALIVSDLITIHQKTGIGKLSAYCGAVCAGAGSGAGIAYLHGEGYDGVSHTIVNALAIVSGIICDGAKPSCAAKIAASVDAGILGYEMFKQGQQFLSGDGIVTECVEGTISNIGRLSTEGMRETDKEIIKIMIENS